MKRVHAENWSLRERLVLASSVLRSGDQNWMSVSRAMRTMCEGGDRPLEWYSQKQCAVQYEHLLNTLGGGSALPKRKKRSLDASSTSLAATAHDTPQEVIVRKLTQERIEELRAQLVELRASYLREKHEKEEVLSGRLDSRLDEIEQADAERDSEFNRTKEQASPVKLEPTTPQPESKPTSPLLTSLLQSPSPALMHRSPTISSLLISSPPVPGPTDTPPRPIAATTLSQLLESPTISSPTTIQKTQSPSRSPATQAPANDPPQNDVVEDELSEKEITEFLTELIPPGVGEQVLALDNVKDDLIDVKIEDIPLVETDPSEVVTDVDPTEVIVAAENIQTEEVCTDRENTSILSNQTATSAISTISAIDDTPDSDLIAETLSELAELDSRTIDMIVVGPNAQLAGGIKEELVEITSTDIDLATGEAAAAAATMKEIIEGAEVVVEGQPDNGAVIEEETVVDSTVVVDNIVDFPTSIVEESIVEETTVATQGEEEEEVVVKMEVGEEVEKEVEVKVEPEVVVTEEAGDEEVVGQEVVEDEVVVETGGEAVVEEEVVVNEEVTQEQREEEKEIEEKEKESEEKEKESGEEVAVKEEVEERVEEEKIVEEEKGDDEEEEEKRTVEEEQVESIEEAVVETIEPPTPHPTEETIKEEVETKDASDEEEESEDNTKEDETNPGDENVEAKEPEKEDMVEEIVSEAAEATKEVEEKGGEEEELEEEEKKKEEEEGETSEEVTRADVSAAITVSVNEIMSSSSTPSTPTSAVLPNIMSIASDTVSLINMRCGVCDAAVPERDIIDCSRCDKNYHYSCQTYFTEPNFRRMSGNARSQWSCANCKKLKKMARKVLTTVVSNGGAEEKEERVVKKKRRGSVTVDSTSRPETPSTEEDNEPVANLAKKINKRHGALSGSSSLPNSPLSINAIEDKAALQAWKKSIMLVYNRLATHKYASLFLKPITNEQALGYHSVIHRPMDLSTIKKNIELGNLRTTVEFQRDMMLMFQNAIMYNNKKTLVYEMATEMQTECIQHIQLMVEAMGEGVPLRSEADESDTLKLTRGSGRVGKSVEPWSQQTAAESSRKRKRSSLPPDTAPSAGSKKKKMQADDEGKKN